MSEEEIEVLEVPEETTEMVFDQELFDNHLNELKSEQSIINGVTAGVVASLVSAIAWAGITYATGYQIGYMAIAVGVIVGFAIKKFGKGYDNSFGVIGAVLSLFGCALGNILTVMIYASVDNSIPFVDLLSTFDFSAAVSIMTSTFDFMDIVFYGIAIYEGYNFSVNKFSEEELATSVVQKKV